ncbi:hypothetical protein R1flu_005905 [Riccia fluitans]|uniref:RRM domain-containing protein n=1 Tax=Riccia fluitans TaxID=41844 RepID=A0ABD1YUH6_9MARC
MKREREPSSWWDWRVKRNVEEDVDTADGQEARCVLEKLVERCVVLDNLSPVCNVHTLRKALEQFGRVQGVKLLKDYLTGSFAGIAITEMECMEQREHVVKELKDYLFMIGQMPRPARATAATVELMIDHPLRVVVPRKTIGRLVSRKDPRWKEYLEVAGSDVLHHALLDELVKQRREEEAKLAKSQETLFQENMDKLKMLEAEKNSQFLQVMKRFYLGVQTFQ